ncbi:unnamed protein product [Pieris macdunnoughi]|uniref:Uncharacterized protein n=1 Tax=Pieris macdunnoughi TaxID=345717 RepID=A0A821XNY5_9NEOP|nr:unnamed protein product [Pieris macdunnoughi]
MRGPYVVLAVLSQYRYELKLVAGFYGKTMLMPWRGVWTPDVCAAFFESGDDDDDSPSSQQPHAIAESSPDLVSIDQPGARRARTHRQSLTRANQEFYTPTRSRGRPAAVEPLRKRRRRIELPLPEIANDGSGGIDSEDDLLVAQLQQNKYNEEISGSQPLQTVSVLRNESNKYFNDMLKTPETISRPKTTTRVKAINSLAQELTKSNFTYKENKAGPFKDISIPRNLQNLPRDEAA